MADEKDGDLMNGDNCTAGSASLEVLAIQEILEECGVEEYDSRVVGMLMDAQFSVTMKMLNLAHGLARHNDKPTIEEEDVQTSNDILGILKNSVPDRQRMIKIASDKNAQPLPQIRHNYGLKLPNDRFCQLQQNVEFKAFDYEPMDTQPQLPPSIPVVEAHSGMVRPEHVQTILKRKATDDDFDT